MRSKPDERTVSDEDRLFEQSYAIRPEASYRYLVHNRTPKRICIIDSNHGEVVLPPLAQRVVSGARLAPFAQGLRPLRQRHQLRVREYKRPRRGSRLGILLIWLAVLVFVGIVITDLLVEGTLERSEVFWSGMVAAVLTVVILVASAVSERDRRRGEEVADTEEGDIEFGVGGAFYDGNDMWRGTKHIFTLLLVLTIGAVLPAIAIFVATDAKDFLVMHGGLHVKVGKESRLVGRVIQVLYTAVLSLFPAILYFQFDRHRVGTIRSEWVRAIFRMDQRMETLADVNARYGDELSEASSYSTDSVRFLGGRNSPILVATLLITLGWTLLVVRTDSFDFAGSSEVTALAESASDAADRANQAAATGDTGPASVAVADAARDEAEQAGQDAQSVVDASTGDSIDTASTVATLPATDEPTVDELAAAATAAASSAASAEARVARPYFQFLVPTPTAATMAFLGAYFFGVYALLRSYFRGDLRPKIYNQITARLITVVVLAYLITTLFYRDDGGNQFVWLLAFLAGVVPTAVLQQIGHAASWFAGLTGQRDGWMKKAFADTFATPRALTQLDGVDIHDNIRFEAEGITDIPSLAKSDIVSTMVSTRVPIDRLVDWTDQAVLVLLLDDVGEKLDGRATRLRSIGVRTASAIVAATEPTFDPHLRTQIETILSTPTGGNTVISLTGLAGEIQREPAMQRILHWYSSDHDDVNKECETITVRTDEVKAPRSAAQRPGSRPAAASNGAHAEAGRALVTSAGPR